MSRERSEDSLATVTAVALIAYLMADLVHHGLGHAGACLALGGEVRSLSSVFVDCSLRGSAVDLAGPLAALAAARLADRPEARLLALLTAAFNLFWFAGQLVFSVASRTDDWAWPLHRTGLTEPLRWTVVVAGAALYALVVRATGAGMAAFAEPPARVRRIALAAWLTAGAAAALTAAFDPHPASTLLRHALPQSLLLSLGLLVAPRHAARAAPSARPAGTLGPSLAWTAAAVVLLVASMAFLGPGVAL